MSQQKDKSILDELKKQHNGKYHGYECVDARIFRSPFRKCEAKIKIMKNVGPQDLDKIFFKLLEKKINTKNKIEKALGVSEHEEFIFRHLDSHLVATGYVCEEDNKYKLTEKGKALYKEKELQKITAQIDIDCYWNYAEEYFEEKIKKDNEVIKALKPPSGEDFNDKLLEEELEKYYNKVDWEKEKEGVFLKSTEYHLKGKPIFKKYFMAYHKHIKNKNDIKIDIFDENRNDVNIFTQKANEERGFWREQLIAIIKGDHF